MWIRPNSPLGCAVSGAEFPWSWTIQKKHVGSHQQTAILPAPSVSISVSHFVCVFFFYCFEFSSHRARTRQAKRTRQRMQSTFTDDCIFFFPHQSLFTIKAWGALFDATLQFQTAFSSLNLRAQLQRDQSRRKRTIAPQRRSQSAAVARPARREDGRTPHSHRPPPHNPALPSPH